MYRVGNASPHHVEMRRYMRTVQFMGSLSERLGFGTATIEGPAAVPTPVKYQMNPRAVPARTTVFVAEAFPAVESEQQQNNSFTATVPAEAGNSQTVSIVHFSTKPSAIMPKVREGEIDAATELCDSFVSVDVEPPATEAEAAVIQDGLCAGLGWAIAAKQAGVSYTSFKAAYDKQQLERNGHAGSLLVADKKVWARIPSK